MRCVYHFTKFIDALTVVNITIDEHKMNSMEKKKSIYQIEISFIWCFMTDLSHPNSVIYSFQFHLFIQIYKFI